jgi:hypothetical protein
MNITKEGDDMSSILDRAAELDREYESEYRRLKSKDSRTAEEESRLLSLKRKLGYMSQISNIECEGCGS